MVKGPDGLEPTGEWKFDASNVLRGCELLGKHLGMFNTLKVVGDTEQPPVQVAVSAGPDFDVLREALIKKVGLKK
jgi:hypothetical protein